MQVSPLKRLQLTAFYSHRSLEGTLKGDTVTSIYKTGLHRTEKEADKRNAFTRQDMGGHLPSWSSSDWSNWSLYPLLAPLLSPATQVCPLLPRRERFSQPLTPLPSPLAALRLQRRVCPWQKGVCPAPSTQLSFSWRWWPVTYPPPLQPRLLDLAWRCFWRERYPAK